MRKFIFFCGLPCSGKSTYLNEKFKVRYSAYHTFFTDCTKKQYNGRLKHLGILNKNASKTPIVVSADEWKEDATDYDKEHPETIHEESVKWARNKVYEVITNTTNDVILDGGGINRSYNRNIIKEVRKLDPNISVKCVFFDTPIDVCLERLSKRDRKVPIENIYEKNQRLTECVQWYQDNCDEFERVNYFTNKYAFIDMDGTLCAYTKGKRDIDGNVDFVNGKLFLNLRPVEHVVNYLTEKYKDNVENFYILTACPNVVAWEEKKMWIRKYMPWVLEDNILFVGNKDYKDVFLKHWLIGHKIDKRDVMMVDDSHPILNKMIKLGVNALHPSDIGCLEDEFTIFG